MEMELAGKVIKPEESKKSLGLLISENLNWTDQVNATVVTEVMMWKSDMGALECRRGLLRGPRM